MTSEEFNLTAIAESLSKSPGYRILRRLTLRIESAPCNRQATKTGTLLNVETNGLNTAQDEIIELAMVNFDYLPNDRITRITGVFIVQRAAESDSCRDHRAQGHCGRNGAGVSDRYGSGFGVCPPMR
jgi:hypothetical protein